MSPDRVQAVARSFVGTPFQHRGRHPTLGMDCVGLLVLTARKLGYPHEDVKVYERLPRDQTLVQICRKYADEIPPAQIGPADIGIFWFDRETRVPQHAAIVVARRDGPGLVHCWEGVGKQGKVVEHAFDKKWRRRLIHAFRLRGVTWPR